MRTIILSSVVALALGSWAVPAPAGAQAPVCPYGYYLASNGQCYPGPAPYYPAPVYEVAPPVYQPPIVFDGLGIGIGLGFGGRGGGWHGDGGHGHR
ncbi:MAG: hypothetical protein ACLPL5_07480 [Stellaceae bacterium]|jgi:hypothetical protein